MAWKKTNYSPGVQNMMDAPGTGANHDAAISDWQSPSGDRVFPSGAQSNMPAPHSFQPMADRVNAGGTGGMTPSRDTDSDQDQANYGGAGFEE